MENNMYKAHPWHGVSIGDDYPSVVNAYIEMVPTDTVKYEIDKDTGHLRIDRPQKYSSQCPSLYGFIPQTYCHDRVGEFCASETGKSHIQGDGDPLDICVLSEKAITHGDILVRAIPIGGIRMIDGDKADDKIIAVLYEDGVYGGWKDIGDCTENLIVRHRHYFTTYKDIPGEFKRKVENLEVYDAATARQVIALSSQDYQDNFSK